MYKLAVLATVAASASAGIVNTLGYAPQALNLGYGYAAAAPAVIPQAAYAAAPAVIPQAAYAAAPAVIPQAVIPAARQYALPAPRTIPGETLKTEVVEPVEQWGYKVAY